MSSKMTIILDIGIIIILYRIRTAFSRARDRCATLMEPSVVPESRSVTPDVLLSSLPAPKPESTVSLSPSGSEIILCYTVYQYPKN